MNVTLHLGDCLEYMRGMDAASVDCVVTSPPYDNLRTYGGHTWDFEGVASELFRVVKEGGVVVWVVNDQSCNGSESGSSFKQALFFMSVGFNLHDTMIYEKNGPSYPSQNKYYQVFEFMFVFSKGKPATFTPIKDRVNRWAGMKWAETRSRRTKEGKLVKSTQTNSSERLGIRFNIWKYNNGAGYTTEDDYAFDHPAMFPEALARDHILSWTNEGDTVFDPFAGSGTTGKMAVKLGRNFIGCEIHEPYFRIAERRIAEARLQLPLDLGV